MCETRDLGIKWSCWHTLVFSNEITIDMRYVCPKDVKKMLVQSARSVHWKTWAAKHEYAELKEGAWLEPGLPFLRINVKENGTAKASQCGQEDLFGRRLDGKETIRYWLVGCQSMSSLPDGGRHREAGFTSVRNGTQEGEIPEAFRKWEQKAKMSKKEWKWQRGTVAHPLSQSQWNRGHFSMKKWESEKQKLVHASRRL